MSYPSSRSTVSGENGGISRKGERLHSREFLPRVPKSRASKRKETLKVGLVVKRESRACKKKKKKKPSWESKRRGAKSRALGVAGRARKNAHFGVLQIKGELKRLSVPGRCQGAAVGTGGREGRERARTVARSAPGPLLGFGGALGIATPPAAYSPNPPLHEGYSLTTSVSIRLLPGLGDDMVSPLPPRRLRRRRRLSSFPRRLSRAPGPGSEEPAAAPAPRWRWQHPRGPVGSSQPPPRPPHGGTPGTVRPSGGGDPAAPGSGCSSPAVVPPRPGPARPRRDASPRDAPSCLL